MSRKWMILAVAGCAAMTAFGGVNWKSDPVQSGQGRRALVGDYSGRKVCILGVDGKVEWQYPAKSVDDVWMLSNGNVLCTTGTGVQEVTPEKEVVFEYKSKSEIYACQRLPDGNTLIGECAAGRLVEVDPAGKVVKTIVLPPVQFAETPAAAPAKKGKKGKRARKEKTAEQKARHIYMRDARKLANGNYLVAHIGEGVVREYDPAGKILREIPAPAGPHSAVRLPDGNTLISCGDMGAGSKVLEVDPSGNVVWKLDANELPGTTLYFVCGLQRLPNGNTVLTNWLGHGNNGKSAHIIEVTPEKEIVWTHQAFGLIKGASCIQVLNVPGDVMKGEVLR